jgi:hypothetical protein
MLLVYPIFAYVYLFCGKWPSDLLSLSLAYPPRSLSLLLVLCRASQGQRSERVAKKVTAGRISR